MTTRFGQFTVSIDFAMMYPLHFIEAVRGMVILEAIPDPDKMLIEYLGMGPMFEEISQEHIDSNTYPKYTAEFTLPGCECVWKRVD